MRNKNEKFTKIVLRKNITPILGRYIDLKTGKSDVIMCDRSEITITYSGIYKFVNNIYSSNSLIYIKQDIIECEKFMDFTKKLVEKGYYKECIVVNALKGEKNV